MASLRLFVASKTGLSITMEGCIKWVVENNTIPDGGVALRNPPLSDNLDSENTRLRAFARHLLRLD